MSIAFPFDEVFPRASNDLMTQDGLNFVLLVVFDKVRRGSGIVRSMRVVLTVRRKEGGVENGVDLPRSWDFEAVIEGVEHLGDLERSFLFGS